LVAFSYAALGALIAPARSLAAAVAPLCNWSTYCTSSTSQNGCNPTLSAVGCPSATAVSGFVIQCTQVENSVNGKFMYSLGPHPTMPPFPGTTSYRCLNQSTLQQLPWQNSGSASGACSGSFVVDWMAWISSHPSALGQPLYAGQNFYVQARFTKAPYGPINLSNGLMFTLTP
jgi:hypothetical protein